MKTLQKHIDEVMEEYKQLQETSSCIHGYALDDNCGIKDFITQAIIKTAQLTHYIERPFNIITDNKMGRYEIAKYIGHNGCIEYLDSKFKAFMGEDK